MHYYYLRDKSNRPAITICLIEALNNIGKGISICSDADSPSLKYGRDKARGRAEKALYNGKDDCWINRERARRKLSELSMPGATYPYSKSMFNPELTAYERKILGIKNEKPTWARQGGKNVA